MTTIASESHHALIFAPLGRDAAIAAALAKEAHVAARICADLPEFGGALGDEVCFAVITEESVRGSDLKTMSAWIAAQPSWSDLPFIVLTQRGGGPERNPGAKRLSEVLGNVSFLERPFHPTTFVSLARSAARGRLRQYEARTRMAELDASQETLRQLNDSLEQRVAARTQQLEAAHATLLAETHQREQAEEQLRQAQKMEAVGQLTGGVAHDFNNLLTIIRSSVDFLRRGGLPWEKQERYLRAIADTSDRAAKLTSQLLAFARRQPLRPEVFDIAERVRGVAELVRPLVGGRVEVEVRIKVCGCACVEADVSQLETALVNLAVNARDAMDSEGTLIFEVAEVACVPAIRGAPALEGRFSAVSVTDTGTGIQPDRLESIFEPFYTTKEVGKGTGLGLSQVYGFVKQSGGDIEVESRPGAGSRFTLYLPASQCQPATQAPAAAAQSRPADETGSMCVLVVEDNEAVGQFATEILADLGHHTVWAGSGAVALRILSEDPDRFDVVFSDVIMPGMNGLDLARTIQERYPQLPVVLTSGYSNVLAQESHHGFELLTKPYTAADLAQTLSGAVERTG